MWASRSHRNGKPHPVHLPFGVWSDDHKVRGVDIDRHRGPVRKARYQDDLISGFGTLGLVIGFEGIVAQPSQAWIDDGQAEVRSRPESEGGARVQNDAGGLEEAAFSAHVPEP
jgi:hypothetical protein